MASKGGPRSRIDHESRAKRQKALEAPREPRRPKTHWDHVLEEMVWLSKDFESERKWKLAQAKKVALRASKGMLDQATRGEKKMKEEEQRLRKVALSISKDVKKFWTKIEKLVLYKHQMELDEKKKKALDKQLEFLLGQTERYSTMLAENLVDPYKSAENNSAEHHLSIQCKDVHEDVVNEPKEADIVECQSDAAENDEEYDVQTEDESEDDERTIEQDEALITKEERQEELAALRNEMDLPIEELLKRYAGEKGESVMKENSPEHSEDGGKIVRAGDGKKELASENGDDLLSVSKIDTSNSSMVSGRRCDESNGDVATPTNNLSQCEDGQSENLKEVPSETANEDFAYDFTDEEEDGDFLLGTEDKDDETTLSDEEKLERVDAIDPKEEIALLQKESDMPVEELLARYNRDPSDDEDGECESDYASALSEDHSDSPVHEDAGPKDPAIPMDEDIKSGEHLAAAQSKEEEQCESPQENLDKKESEHIIADAAAAARSAQPTGNTFSTTNVRTKFPFLLKYSLREYQHIGLDWLVTMYEKRLNGILADEMGLGKTIMTISLLAHLACDKGIWGPHLIVVPTSVMLNWETEFLKWCPAFKILTYFGSAKERKLKRQGWLKPNSFHVCITTYRLVIQDSKVFKRKKWKYLILDEAHLIKNWKSQRWQTLLNFNSKRRILLTGTPLQNDLMELWSLMHFLMPHVFQSHQEFKDWFSNPISVMVEGEEKVNKEVVDRLHNVLRPFLLRRLKRDVEKQLPMKHEHVIYCRLSKRQRNLYEDFIASSETQATLASSNFFGMISIIMQLRKVCNHPDLFEGRPIVSSFDMCGIDIQLSSSVCSMLLPSPFSMVDLRGLGLLFTHLDYSMAAWESDEVQTIETPATLIMERIDMAELEVIRPLKCQKKLQGTNIFEEIQRAIWEERLKQAKERVAAIAWWNSLRCKKRPIYSTTLRDLVTLRHPVYDIHQAKANPVSYLYSSKLADIVLSPVERFQKMTDVVESFMFSIPAARAPSPVCWCSTNETNVFLHPSYKQKCSEVLLPLLSPIRPAIVRRQVYFPDRRLIQFDCGKLQELAILLRKLKSEGHRALIFTQMTKMLDILEAFISLYGYTYMRLDGSTQPEDRQTLMQRFNTNPKYFLFILSTRSGGVGINLVGADTVIFYDSDWNPAMDQQAQDRCHRIGQTREVHIYRLISESTIEENILKKANQKRALDNLVIQSGGYNTEFFKKLDPMELFSGHRTLSIKNMPKEKNHNNGEVSVTNADVEAALKCVEDEADYLALKKVELEEAVDNQEFTEEAVGRLEEDEYVNEDDETAELGESVSNLNKENVLMLNGSDHKEDRPPHSVAVNKEDDPDMLADVEQMAAAAAAAGQAISAFENELRPIDRYAIRFLELWDPIIDKTALESEVRIEDTEWELDRIEKYKEEMEAEIDEDEEPLVYESWDADVATIAYRQQVEALAQHQLMEELEYEARQKEAEEQTCDSKRTQTPGDSKPKSKKKPKKAKFKSLKKGSLTSGLRPVKEESQAEPMNIDDEDVTGLDFLSPNSTMQKKRKKSKLTTDGEEEKRLKKSKKSKRDPPDIYASDLESNSLVVQDEHAESKTCESLVDLEQKTASRSKMGGKISITPMPVKRVWMIKPEKLKKGNHWSKDCIPSADFWLPQEDAILCAVVHEYGPNWSLVSETLYGMTAGGSYRGRYRHPVHCCERFRELFQKYVLLSMDNANHEKINSPGSGKALLKVTEDNIRMLLDVASEQVNRELLLQKHFFALLSSVWKVASRVDCRQNPSTTCNGLYFDQSFYTSIGQPSQNSLKKSSERMAFANLAQSKKLVAAALDDITTRQVNDKVILSNQEEDMPVTADQLDITLEFPKEDSDILSSFPSVINLSIDGTEPTPSLSKQTGEDDLKVGLFIAENRFREAARVCEEDSSGWASSAFPTNDARSRPGSRIQSSGKQKSSVADSSKPSRSKSKKASMDPSEMHHHQADSIFQSMPSLMDLRIDLTSLATNEAGIDAMDSILSSDLNGESSLEMESVGIIPHDYVAGLISDLDDCTAFPEYTDIR